MSNLPKSNAQSVALWIRAWFLLSSFIVLWDAGYCLSRPHSMEGGKWNFLWRPYNLYGKIDTFYGAVAFEESDGFTGGQAFMNLVETALNFLYLYLLRLPSVSVDQANLVGFTSASMTLAKTVLYWLVEWFSGMRHSGHNNWQDYIFLWVIPNGAWILVPGLISISLGKKLWRSLGAQHQKTQ